MRSKIVTLSVPEAFLREVDAAAARERRARSELFREAVRQYLAREERWSQLRAWGRQTAARSGIHSEGDVVRVVREWRHEQARKKRAQRRPTHRS